MDAPEDRDASHCMNMDSFSEIWWKHREPMVKIYCPIFEETREYRVKNLRKILKVLTCSMCNATRHI